MALTNCTVQPETILKAGGTAIGSDNINLTIIPDNGYSLTASSFTIGTLPTGVDSIVLTDTGVIGRFTNKINVAVNLTDLYSMPNADTTLTIDIDGDADRGEKEVYRIQGDLSGVLKNATGVADPLMTTGYDQSGAVGTQVTLFTYVITTTNGFSIWTEPTHKIYNNGTGLYSADNYQITKTETTGTYQGKDCTVVTIVVKYTFPEYDSSEDTISLVAEANENKTLSTGKIHNVSFERQSVQINWFGDYRTLTIYGDVGATTNISAYDTTSTGVSLLGGDYDGILKTITIGEKGTYKEDILFPGNTGATPLTYSVLVTEINSTSFLFNSGNSPYTISLTQNPSVVITHGLGGTGVGSTFTVPASITNTYKPGQTSFDTITPSDLNFEMVATAVGGNIFRYTTNPVILNRDHFGTTAEPLGTASADQILDGIIVGVNDAEAFVGRAVGEADSENGAAAYSENGISVTIDNNVSPATATFTGKLILESVGLLNDTFELDVSDACGINTAPSLANASISTAFNTPLGISLSSYATNTDNDILTYSAVSSPGSGSLSSLPNTTGGTIYTPTAGTSGTDSFTYKVNDGYIDSNTATVTIAVAANAVYSYMSVMKAACTTLCSGDFAMNIATLVDSGNSYTALALGDVISGGLADGWYAVQDTNNASIVTNVTNSASYKIIEITTNAITSIAENNGGTCAIQ